MIESDSDPDVATPIDGSPRQERPTWLVVERTAIAVHLFPIEVVGVSRFFVSTEPTAACGFVLRGKKGATFSVRAADESDGWDICGGCTRTVLGRAFPPPVDPYYGYEVGPATAQDRRLRRRRGMQPGWFRATIELAFQAPTIEDAEVKLRSSLSIEWVRYQLNANAAVRLEPMEVAS